MSFKIKRKPTKPVRKNTRKVVDLCDDEIPFEKLVAEVELIKAQGPHSKIYIEVETERDAYSDYESHSLCIRYIELESDEDFNKRIKEWKQNVLGYTKWQNANSTAIDAEKKKVAEKKSLKAQLKAEYDAKLQELNKE